MSFLALQCNQGTTYPVFSFSYDIFQPTDGNNMPSGNPKGGIIRVSIYDAMLSDDTLFSELQEWALSSDMKKDGVIALFEEGSNTLADGSQKFIGFTNAFCVGYIKMFDRSIVDEQAISKIHLTLSAQELQITGGILTNTWPGMQPSASSSGSGGNSGSKSNLDFS